MAGGRQYETDVAIVGAGGAGIAAGLEARAAGARAIAFEQAGTPGGAAIISGGGCLIVGSPLQKENAIDDTPDLAGRRARPHEDERSIDHVVEHGSLPLIPSV